MPSYDAYKPSYDAYKSTYKHHKFHPPTKQWIEHCATCIRFRKRPTKQDSVAVRPVDMGCWEEVMVDFEGPSSPTDKAGNKYVLTYVCCLCHGVLFKPNANLTWDVLAPEEC